MQCELAGALLRGEGGAAAPAGRRGAAARRSAGAAAASSSSSAEAGRAPASTEKRLPAAIAEPGVPVGNTGAGARLAAHVDQSLRTVAPYAVRVRISHQARPT